MGFLCHLCGKEFSTKQNYTRHWMSLHEEDISRPNGGNNRISCSMCGKWYKRKENLQKHIATVHKPEQKEHYMKKCELCDKKVDRGSYKRHMLLKHRPLIGEVNDKPRLNCSMCSAKFNTNSSLSYHNKKVHKIKTNKTTLTIKCPLCNFITKGPSRIIMQSHFANNHNITIEYKSCHFKTIDEFFAWKSEIEKQTTSKFIRAKTKSDVIMFKCHRSGRYNSMTIKRNLRTTGSCKINGFCPAFVKAKIVGSDGVNVTYQLTHVGHKNELRHISLTAEERKAIAVLLAQNVPFDEILKRIRGSLSNSPLQRIHLTSRKDIHNIKKAFDLNAIAVEHPFDLKTEDENIFNLKTESYEQPVQEEVIVEDTVRNEDMQDLESNSVAFDPKTEDGNVLVLKTDSVDCPVEQNIEEQLVDNGEVVDYNDISIEHTFDITAEELENTYEVIAESVEQQEINTEGIKNYEVIGDETENTDQHDVETVQYVYELDAGTVENSFDYVDKEEYPVNFNAEVDDTEEAVENLLKLNVTEFKQFLDHESLNKWVQNLRTSQNTSLALYKPQGCYDPEFPGLVEDDFLLIYMTEAQKDILIKDSKDIVFVESILCNNVQLYALLIPDETRDGFPVAFMFTNRGDEVGMFIFFEKVKEVVGLVIPKAFMTNEDTFYSTWMKSMGGDTLHLYCSRYVLQSWRTDVNKIKVKEKRNQVYKTLQSLLYELDEGNFHTMLEECVAKWRREEGMTAFFEYFCKLFVVNDRFKKWAYCFRVNAGINSSVSIDSFNRILKYCNLRGDKVKLSDKTLCDILNLLRVKVFELVIKINKGKVAKKLQNLRLRHGYSYTNDSEYVIQDENKWQVYNYVGSEISEVYTVKKLKACNKCLLQCHQCNSCFHEYVCSCSDHLLKNNMCKHIHLVARTQKLMENNQEQTENSMEISTLGDGSDSQNFKLELETEIGVEQISDTDLPFAVRKRQLIEDIKKCLEENIESVEELEYAKKQWQPILTALKIEKHS